MEAGRGRAEPGQGGKPVPGLASPRRAPPGPQRLSLRASSCGRRAGPQRLFKGEKPEDGVVTLAERGFLLDRTIAQVKLYKQLAGCRAGGLCRGHGSRRHRWPRLSGPHRGELAAARRPGPLRKPAQARRSREWWGESKKRRCAGRLPPPPHSAPSPAPASTSRDPEPPTATTTFSPVEKTPDCSEITIGWGDRWMPPEKKKGWRQPSRRPWVSRRQQSSSDGHPADLSRDASGSCFLLTAAPTSAPQLRSAQQPKQKGDSSVSSLGGCKASLWLFQPLRKKEMMGKIWSAHKDILEEECTFMYKIAQAPRMRHYFSTA
nr:uncharacterized protein LOC102119422 [Macaca fascicularis]